MILNIVTYNWSWVKHSRVWISMSTYRKDCFCDLLMIITKVDRMRYWRLVNWHDTIFFRLLLISLFLKFNDIQNIKMLILWDLFAMISIFNTFSTMRVIRTLISLHMIDERILRNNITNMSIFKFNLWDDKEISS